MTLLSASRNAASFGESRQFNVNSIIGMCGFCSYRALGSQESHNFSQRPTIVESVIVQLKANNLKFGGTSSVFEFEGRIRTLVTVAEASQIFWSKIK